jgi:hypothetical protein
MMRFGLIHLIALFVGAGDVKQKDVEKIYSSSMVDTRG